MKSCLLCGSEVEITPPDWSGGLMTVHCSVCGKYKIGSHLVEEIIALRKNESHWIPYLRYEIASSPEIMKIAKVPGYESYRLEPANPPRLSREQKKWRRRKPAENVTPEIKIYYSGEPGEGSDI